MGVEVIIKQPYRKAFKQGNIPSIFLTLPKELGIRPGDLVFFRIEDGKIILEKMGVKDGV